MNDKIPKILEHVRNKIENSDDNIKHIIEQQGNDYVRFWKKTAKGIGALSLLILVVGIWQTATMMFVAPTPEALQSSTSLLAAQTTDMPVTDTPILHHHDDKPATITDNEIKNTIVQSADRHDEPILTAEQNIITDVPTQKNETANLLQKHNAIAENIDTPKPKIYCSNGCSDEYIMGLFDECVLA